MISVTITVLDLIRNTSNDQECVEYTQRLLVGAGVPLDTDGALLEGSLRRQDNDITDARTYTWYSDEETNAMGIQGTPYAN